MKTKTKVPDIPITDTSPGGLSRFMTAVREVLQVREGTRGDALDKNVTYRDLVSSGLAQLPTKPGTGPVVPRPGSGGGGGGGNDGSTDLTPPPPAANLMVSAGFATFFVSWTAPVYSTGGGNAYTEVWGAQYSGSGDKPTFANATLLSKEEAAIFAFPGQLGVTMHFWVVNRSKAGVAQTVPTGGTNGVSASTGRIGNADLAPLSVTAAQLAADAVDLSSNKVTGTITDPARFGALAVGYTVTQYLLATEGVMQNLKVDSAQIGSLSVGKLTTGALAVGQSIASQNYASGSNGWTIRADGYAEFGAASIRGRLNASQIDGKGLSIYKPNGDILLNANAAGAALPWSEVSGRPSDDAIRNNLIDLSFWKRLGAIPWGLNGDEENTLYATSDVGGVGPKGGSDIVWYARERNGNGEQGGGWEGVPTSGVDPSKTYRFVVPIRKRDGSGGSAYWGPLWNQVCNLNSTAANGNPYFASISRDSLLSDRWYLFVGYVFPYGSTGNTNDGAGIWDCKTGALIAAGANYNHNAGGAAGHRAYQFYATPGSTQLFGRPMINLVDGSEPSLREYFESSAVLASALALGTNLVANSDQTSAMTWVMGNVQGVIDTGPTWASNLWSTDYTLQGGTTKNITIHQNNNNGQGDAGVCCDIYPLGSWDLAHSVPVIPGQRYCFSAYQMSHRCHVGVGLQWFDRSGNYIADLNSGTNPTSWSNADFLSNYTRPFVIGVAPSGAAYARPYMRKYNTISGYGESWWWGAAPQLEAVGAAATGPGPYCPAPATSTRQLGYNGDLNATNGATIGANLFGQFNQSSFDIVMNGQALIRAAHIASLNVGQLSTAWSGGAGSGQARIELALGTATWYRSNNSTSVRIRA